MNANSTPPPEETKKGLNTLSHLENKYTVLQDRQGLEDRSLSRRWYYLGAILLVLGILFRQPLFVVVGVLLTLVLAAIDLWAHYCLRNISYERRLSAQRVLFGEEITLSLIIENTKLLPLPWLELEDIVPAALDIQDQKLRSNSISNILTLDCLFSLRWYDRVTRRYMLRCNTRGIHTFGPTRVSSGDLFGFVHREAELASYQYLLVYPLIVPITNFGLPARHPFGEQRTPRRLLEDPARVVGVRDYAYGDSLRRVNWKATARTQHLQSKVYEASTTYTLVLFLNTSARRETYYDVRPELQELSICAAASLTEWATSQRYAVGLYANGSMHMPDEPHNLLNAVDERDEAGADQSLRLEAALASMRKKRRIAVPPTSNETQHQRILEVLARVGPFFGSTIEEILQAERSHLPSGATVVLITTSISERLIDILVRIRQSGHAVSILFVGDSPLPIKIAGVTLYHIGGEEAWNRLLTAYSTDTQQRATPLPTLHL